MTDVLTQNQEQQTTLPDTWIQATFGDLADYLNGRAFKKSEWHSTGRPIIRIQNLTGSSGTLNRFTGPVEDRYIVRDGELLISWSATLGAYVYRGEEAVLNQHIFKVEPHVNRRFLFYLTNAYIDDLRRQAHGSGMQHITKSKFEASKVPLPPSTNSTASWRRSRSCSRSWMQASVRWSRRRPCSRATDARF